MNTLDSPCFIHPQKSWIGLVDPESARILLNQGDGGSKDRWSGGFSTRTTQKWLDIEENFSKT
jgi:hypothetical protein